MQNLCFDHSGDNREIAEAATAEWYAVIAGEQLGPLDRTAICARFAAGEIDGESYVWREGLADWLRLEAVDEFAELARAEPAPLPKQLTSQRGENSVLFSLADLQAMGGPASPALGCASPMPGAASGAGSGLIDIRAMAGIKEQEAAPLTSGLDGTFVRAPVLIPVVATQRPRWVLPTLTGGGVIVLALAVTLALVLVQDNDSAPLPRVTVTMLRPVAPVPSPVARAKAAGVAPEKTAPTGGAKTKGAPVAKRPVAKRLTKRRRAKHLAAAKHRRWLAAKRRAAKEKSPSKGAKKDTRKHARSELERLLDGALKRGSTGSASTSTVPTARPPARKLPKRLDHGQIVKGMRGIHGKVRACFDRYRVPGTAMLRVTIGASGRVSKAKVSGLFSGTPTGTCIGLAVKSARFAETQNAATIDYAFNLG